MTSCFASFAFEVQGRDHAGRNRIARVGQTPVLLIGRPVTVYHQEGRPETCRLGELGQAPPPRDVPAGWWDPA